MWCAPNRPDPCLGSTFQRLWNIACHAHLQAEFAMCPVQGSEVGGSLSAASRGGQLSFSAIITVVAGSLTLGIGLGGQLSHPPITSELESQPVSRAGIFATHFSALFFFWGASIVCSLTGLGSSDQQMLSRKNDGSQCPSPNEGEPSKCQMVLNSSLVTG
jgi:hypothetical protein